MDDGSQLSMGKKLEFQRSSETSATTDSQTQTTTIDVIGFLRLTLKHRRLLVGATLCAGILTAGVTLLIPNKYTSTARILPSGGDKLSALKGMTGLSILDFARGSVGDANSSELFPTILTSERVQNSVLKKRLRFTSDGEAHELTLQEYVDEDNLDKARKALAKIVSVSTEFKTGVITLSVTTKYPEFSAKVARAFITELDLFNRTQRKTKATEYERFVAGQLAETETHLGDAEEALKDFQKVNRDWALSSNPEIQQEMLRLQRNLEIKTKTFALLTQQHEIARAEAQKDLPVVQALDAPAVPLIKSAPKRTVTVLMAMLAAAMLSMAFIFVREAVNRSVARRANNSAETLAKELAAAFPRIASRIAHKRATGRFNVPSKSTKSESETVRQ